MKFSPLDPSQVVLYPLEQRKSLVATEVLATTWKPGGQFREFLSSLPRALAAADLCDIARRMAQAVRDKRPIILGMGAHPIKVGLSPLIIDLLERGIVSAVALNGAGIIHDFELAYRGETSEDVASALADGSFGMARETGAFLNGAIATGVKKAGIGIGQAVGEQILTDRLPYRHLSIVAACVRLEIPISVHVTIGADIIHMHPQVDGAAVGEGSLRDFYRLAGVVARLEGGVFINLGSAVVIPEVFLKTLALARNLGHAVNHFTTVDLDFIRHYRSQMNVVTRPTLQGGRGFHVTGHHEIMFPLLCAAVLEELAGSPA